MATRKIEVNEDDLKKVILMLKLSKPHLQLPSDDLGLCNLWRVSGKLADKLMRKAELVMVTSRGRTVLKHAEEVSSEIKEEAQEEKPAEVEPPVVEEVKRVPRCRKRKSK